MIEKLNYLFFGVKRLKDLIYFHYFVKSLYIVDIHRERDRYIYHREKEIAKKKEKDTREREREREAARERET